MFQVCCYQGCGIVYGEKEPLDDQTKTHGLCPLHYKLTLKQIRTELKEFDKGKQFLKVLIIEDNLVYRQLLTKAVRERFPEIQIEGAENWREALFKVEVFNPELIFMDIQLPGENGLELSKKIKARFPGTVIVILTGHDLPEYRTASREFTDYFISKNASPAESIFNIMESFL
ncbi:MAG TPA: response regulator transcription factor [Thermodesulfobacteriota bacterium]|nr:response regulator transcription factor [Thermodesulfobacteriota bacterium]